MISELVINIGIKINVNFLYLICFDLWLRLWIYVKIILLCVVDEFVWEVILSSLDYIRMFNNDIKYCEFFEEKLYG